MELLQFSAHERVIFNKPGRAIEFQLVGQPLDQDRGHCNQSSGPVELPALRWLGSCP
jgi:hypothetical protein